jgi:hypothetical protein
MASVLLGKGTSGPLQATTTVKVDKVKTTVSYGFYAGGRLLSVGSTAGFSIGDEVLIIMMVDSALIPSTAGRYELNVVKSINSGSSLTLEKNLSYNYLWPSVAQVLRIPHFTDVTVEAGGVLTCDPWNGMTGGIVFFRATGTIEVKSGGKITASGMGFKGGRGTTVVWQCGNQGESPVGGGSQGKSPNLGGGGGSSPDGDCVATASGNGSGGGGGGGYGAGGSPGGDNGSGGAGSGGLVYGTANLSRLHLGSGGGGSGKDDNQNNPNHANGGAGGGIVAIFGARIFALGEISSAGANGEFGDKGGGTPSEVGGGGGGSGGSVHLGATQLVFFTSKVLATGGMGGPPVSFGGTGGTGGAGRIHIDYGILNGQGFPNGSPADTTPPADLGPFK